MALHERVFGPLFVAASTVLSGPHSRDIGTACSATNSGAGLVATASFQYDWWCSRLWERNRHDCLNAAYDDNWCGFGGSIPWRTNSPDLTSEYFLFSFGVKLKTLYTAGDVIHCLNVANSLQLHWRQFPARHAWKHMAGGCSPLWRQLSSHHRRYGDLEKRHQNLSICNFLRLQMQ
jgi:hypothetical protein